MSLEKLGAVAAFIPFVSTITGVIKAIVYYNKAHKPAVNKETEGLAKKTDTIGSERLNVKEEKTECYESLWKTSIAEAIPGANVIAALYSAVVLLPKLSELRDVNKFPGQFDKDKNGIIFRGEDHRKAYLLKKYNIKEYAPPNEYNKRWQRADFSILKNNALFDALVHLHELRSQNPHYSKKIQDEVKQKQIAPFIKGWILANTNATPEQALKAAIQDATERAKTDIGRLNPDYENEVMIDPAHKIKPNGELESQWTKLLILLKDLEELNQHGADRFEKLKVDLPPIEPDDFEVPRKR